MITITQKPSETSFAGNPVLLKVSSGLKDKTFLKACAKVVLNIYQRGELLSSNVRTLSIPTNGGREEVTFDLSDLLLSALSQVSVERTKALSVGNSPSISSGYVRYTVQMWDEYLDEYSEVVSTEDTASQSTGVCFAIPGAYTDMQRLLRPEDTESYLGTLKLLSSKPDFEVIPLGGGIVQSFYSKSDAKLDFYLDRTSGTSPVTSASLYENEVAWHKVDVPESVVQGLHSLTVAPQGVAPTFFYVMNPIPFTHYFEFVNRLGAVESIYTFGRATRKRKLTQERQVVKYRTSFRPTSRYVKRTLQEEEAIALSTGPVSREWAQWFISEFFTAEKVWMYSEEANDMIPVVVECEEDMDVFSESAAEVLDLPFTVVKCING